MGQPGIDIVASSKQSRTVWHVCLQCQFGTKGGRCRSKCRGATKEVEVEAEQQNLVLLLAKRRRGALARKRVSEESKLWQSDPDVRHFT